jgi:hypothetical protein
MEYNGTTFNPLRFKLYVFDFPKDISFTASTDSPEPRNPLYRISTFQIATSSDNVSKCSIVLLSVDDLGPCPDTHGEYLLSKSNTPEGYHFSVFELTVGILMKSPRSVRSKAMAFAAILLFRRRPGYITATGKPFNISQKGDLCLEIPATYFLRSSPPQAARETKGGKEAA